MTGQDKTIKSTVVIPNYNGILYIENCLVSLMEQDWEKKYRVIVVDNHSTDGSLELIKEKFPQAELICNRENTGFCKAVNEGIQAADTEYVILLNNDTTVKPGFVSALEAVMEKHPKAFSAGAKMLDMKQPDIIDDAGDLYCAMGWAFARGKGKNREKFDREEKVFFACGGGAIYRKKILDEIGLFDEEHFAYLEDLDIGYRAKIFGYENYYTPNAVVYHAGSASSGSRYNAFKVSLSSRNNVYVVYKNMPLLQQVINLPFLLAGYLIKWGFFLRKGLGKNYASGIMAGIKRNLKKQAKQHKIPFRWKNLGNYFRIQGELWKNLILRIYY